VSIGSTPSERLRASNLTDHRVHLRTKSNLRKTMRRPSKTRYPLALLIFLSLSLNLIFAPAIHAATGSDTPRTTAYALGILGLVTVALSIYLFVVIFQPEKF
jgi:K+-transporting ATPase KdpF subunit